MIWLPIDLAKRMATNRGADATVFHGRFEIRRNSQYLGSMSIVNDCICYLTLYQILAQQS